MLGAQQPTNPTGADTPAVSRAPSRNAGSASVPPAPCSVSRESSAPGYVSSVPVQVFAQAPPAAMHHAGYVWQCSGGTLPVAAVPTFHSASSQMLRATSAVRSVTPSALPTARCHTPRSLPVMAMPVAWAVPGVATPGACASQVGVVRDLSPGRPVCSGPLRSFSPGRPVILSPRLVPAAAVQQRPLSPALGLRQHIPQSPKHSPSEHPHTQNPLQAEGNVCQTASPQRMRSMSPVGLPAAPLVAPLANPQPPVAGQSAPAASQPGVVAASEGHQRGISPNRTSVVVRHPAPSDSASGSAASGMLQSRTVPSTLATPRSPSSSGAPVSSSRGSVRMTAGEVLQGLRTAAPRSVARTPTRPLMFGRAGPTITKRASSSSAVSNGPRTSENALSVLPPGRSGSNKDVVRVHERRHGSSTPSTGAGALPPRKPSAVMLGLSSPVSQVHDKVPEVQGASKDDPVTEEDPRYVVFSRALDEPGAAEAACKQLLSKLPGSGGPVRWEDLLGIDPIFALCEAATIAVSSPPRERQVALSACGDLGSDVAGCKGWWRALLARQGLYGPGNVCGAAELSELFTAALRMLRDRYAPEAYLRNLRTVHRGSHRLKDRYGSFEFLSRGMLGKSYRCKSRLTREEHVCRQVRKDRLLAPSDLIRAEVEVLRGLEHPNIPQVIACFEDFNNHYLVLEPIDSVELLQILQQWHGVGKSFRFSWLAEVSRQLLEALKHCHELRPHSLVHGDLRLTSILLSADTDPEANPKLVLSDVGLAGLPPSPLPCSWRRRSPVLYGESVVNGQSRWRRHQPAEEDWFQCASPKIDIWSCGCLLFLLLSGQHPFGADLASRSVPAVAAGRRGVVPPEPDWRLLPSAAAASLCAQMLSWDIKVRPSAADCLRHSWLSSPAPSTSDDETLPVEALGFLLQLHARSKLQQVVAGLVISEQIDSPFSSVGAAMAVQFAFADTAGIDRGAAAGLSPEEAEDLLTPAVVSAEEASSALAALGVSAKGVDKVVKAFTLDPTGNSIDWGLLSSSCNELAEDLLDHSLWRVFTAAGEDHRGVLGATELENALSEGSGAGGGPDRAAGGGAGMRGLLGSELKTSDIVRQIACGSQEVTFEELKEVVVSRQAAPYATKLGPGMVALAGTRASGGDA
eukprot:TRINITY_DN24420_c0_g1_i1.p1 TRINITY_DN24420_c0_g1~~TRINITY_DN24420_c0_g1_i1.p1  ORF type:complete len:1141 (-),score=181.07 TRINITY_DN24420_c0_g1_i1:129-3551(-)